MPGSCMRAVPGLLACAFVVVLAAPVAVAQALEVVVTIKPLHALVARVMAGVGTPHLLVRGAQSAHTYALKPSDVARLNRADVLFRMSEAMEPFTARVVRSLPQRVQVVTLQDTPGLLLLKRRTDATFVSHAAHSLDDRAQALGHGPDPGAVDGHAWLDPVNAKAMAGYIAQALSGRAPEHAQALRANAARLKADLDALSEELRRELAGVAGRPYVVFHDALQYFEARYGLAAAGAIAVSPEVPPGARRLSALRRQVAGHRAVCVLAEPQFDTRLVDAVAEGTGARVGTVDPEGSRIAAGPDLYFRLLRALASDLKSCLAPTG